MTNKTLGYAAAIGAAILWAGNFVVARAIAQEMPPVQLNFWRWFVALLSVLPFGIFHIRKDLPSIRKNFTYILVQAFISVTILNTFVYQAGKSSTSIHMVLFIPAAPIIILLLSRFICGEAISKRRFYGLTIILTGLVVLMSRGSLANLQNLQFHAADFWSLGGIFCFGLYSFLGRFRPMDMGNASFHIALFSLGLIMALPMVCIEMAYTPAAVWNSSVITGILYAGIACSGIAFVLWSLAIEHIGPVAAAMIYYTIPLFTAIQGVLLLGEKVTTLHVAGGILMLIGIVLACSQTRGNQHHTQEK